MGKMSTTDSKRGELPFNFIDLFAGAGGFSCGLEKAGMNCVLGVDHDKYAMETFAHNHKTANTYCGDIAELKGKKLKELTKGLPINLIVGGPPCQGFSTVGPGNPNDQRNALFLHFFRIVKTLRPQYIMIENVTGLLAKKNESTLHAIFKKFASIGYQLAVQVMAAHDYGVPEKRRRTIIIGSRVNQTVTFPNAKKGPFKTVGHAIRNLKTAGGKVFNHDETTAKLKSELDLKRLKKVPEGKGIRYQQDEEKYLPPSLRLGVDWSKMRENRFRQTKFFRLDRKSPSPTIMTHRHTYFHPTKNRYLTAREAAAIQSFPNNFEFKGPLSAQWRQIGNAVPPGLAKCLGCHILKLFKESRLPKTKTKNTLRVKEQATLMRKSAFVYQQDRC